MKTHVEADTVEVALLRTFLAVVKYGSIGKTAVAVDKTQPAVSQQMLRLERIVGQKLFARGRDGVKLTRHGHLLVSYAHRAVELNEEILLRLRGKTAGRRLTVGMSADVALAGLAAAMKRFQSPHSDIELNVIVTAANALDALLKAGELDWAIGDPSLMTGTPTEKWSVRLERASSAEVDFVESRPLPLVLFGGPCPWQNEMLDSLRCSERAWRVVLESTSFDAILAAVQSGLGITALPALAIQEFALARFRAVHLPRPPVIEFGMFRAATCLSSCTSTSLEPFDPVFDGSSEAVALPQAAAASRGAQVFAPTKSAVVWVPRRSQCRVRYINDSPGASDRSRIAAVNSCKEAN